MSFFFREFFFRAKTRSEVGGRGASTRILISGSDRDGDSDGEKCTAGAGVQIGCDGSRLYSDGDSDSDSDGGGWGRLYSDCDPDSDSDGGGRGSRSGATGPALF